MPAIFIGRFQPLHKGHLEAIKWILKKKKEIFIFIGSLQESWQKDNPFSFFERKEMIERVLFREGIKNFEIFGAPDFLEDEIWAKKVLEIGKLNKNKVLVFTQNSWTKNCFEKIGVKVLPHPIFFNGLCATEIRERVAKNKNWQNLVPQSVFDFLKKIEGEKRIKFLDILPEERIINFIKEKVKEAEVKGGIVGVSGGIDSSLIAFLTKKALGEKSIFLNMSFIKSCPLIDNVSLLEKKLRKKIKRIYLGDIYEALLKILPPGDKISEGNLKPRLRMAALYYFANLYNLFVIGTTNKSETELGYFTKFGDGGVDIEPIADLYKTEVIKMAKRLKLPKEIIETIPTADLWSGQTDEKEIGISYQRLDMVLKLLSHGFREKEISLLTDISQNKIKDILERKRKNAHKLFLPPICQLRF